MLNLSTHAAFGALAITCIALCLNLMFLWASSGVARARSKTAMNPEDAAVFGAALVQEEPPAVARVLRAHRNAEASIVPFLLLALVFVLAGGGATFAVVVFGIFTVARWLHTAAYLMSWQPWRSVFFAVGVLCIVALMVGIALQFVR